MTNSELALVMGAALAGLAFVVAIPRTGIDVSAPEAPPAQILNEKANFALASDWRWPIAEEPEAVTTETLDAATADDAPRRRCRRRRCR